MSNNSPPAQELPHSAFTQGLLWMGLSMISFIGMSVGSRELASTLSIQQVLFFRALVGLFVILTLGRALLPELRKGKLIRLHLARNVVHFFAQYLWTIGVVMLPLASVFALEFTMPIWVAFFALLFLKEQLTRSRILATIGGFIGVLVIVRPGIGMVDPAAGLVLIAAAGYGLSLILVKQLTREVSPGAIVVWMIVIQLPLGFLASLTDWRPVSFTDIPWMLIAGLGALAAHYCQAQALKRLDASVVMPIDFLRVPMAAIVGYYAYVEAIDLWVFLGGGIILFSNYRAVMVERRKTTL
ncbi:MULTISPECIES: DMT family transporter [Agrobacterium]|uniref:DMT family transporter n=2 Tax=Agrobacterium salinitolerans TaxID=1183413 RepID=A0A9X3R289_9HYPH|nr:MULTISPECIES: DMT family transporter [Agrobacterium]SOC89962.1 S-adenosylmethionine uptake transporter [Ensifer adhaerens]MCZ7854896.1 DMT family transporter [Agrobacterium salinitolerans]MCZ7940539.1 DMT family transporter [Agrobacterium salinitolerans]MDA5631338.1 DMT family transporter [Agrobacterium sp. ST15.16.055]MDA6982351.1 DMT family transporter [Agrobacterium salinitolerans]